MATAKKVPAPSTVDEVASQMNAAETMDDLWNVPLALNVDDVLGKPLVLNGFELTPGDFGGDYAIINATDAATGEQLDPISCGGQMIISFLQNTERIGGFPVEAKIVRRGRALRFVPVS